MKEFQEIIDHCFAASVLPVWVPGIDIKIDKNETIFTAVKRKSNKIYVLSFIIRDDEMKIINADVYEDKEFVLVNWIQKLIKWINKL